MKAFVFCGVIVLYLYGTIEHEVNRKHDNWQYHNNWPLPPCHSGSLFDDNPHHHPNHCWKYFERTESYSYPNPNNGSYPPRQRKNGPLEPYGTSTSLVYLLGALALVYYEKHYHMFDVGGIALSMVWVAAGSMSLHNSDTQYASVSDWHVIGPLLVWVGVEVSGIPAKWMGYILKLILVVVSIFWGYENEQTSVLYAASVLFFGYFVVYHVKKYSENTLDMTHLYDACTVVLFFFAGGICKTYGGTVGDMFSPIKGIMPSHNYGTISECTNNVNLGRLQDISHATWHVCAFTGLWIIINRAFEHKDNNTKPFNHWIERLAFCLNALGIIICCYLNTDNYSWWLATIYTGLTIQTLTTAWATLHSRNLYTLLAKSSHKI